MTSRRCSLTLLHSATHTLTLTLTLTLLHRATHTALGARAGTALGHSHSHLGRGRTAGPRRRACASVLSAAWRRPRCSGKVECACTGVHRPRGVPCP